MVSSELGVGALERGVSVRLRLLDTVKRILSASRKPNSGNGLNEIAREKQSTGEDSQTPVDVEIWELRTRSCGSSSPGCAGTSSLILETGSAKFRN